MTTLRVLPEDVYHQVMHTDAEVEKDSVFEEVVRRFGSPTKYEKSSMGAMSEHMHGGAGH